MGDLNHTPSVELSIYSQDLTVKNSGDIAVALGTLIYGTSAAKSCSFYVGLDVENYAKSDKSTIFSGYNSNTDDIHFVSTYNQQAAVVTVRFDAFALFDTVLVFENSTCLCEY